MGFWKEVICGLMPWLKMCKKEKPEPLPPKPEPPGPIPQPPQPEP